MKISRSTTSSAPSHERIVRYMLFMVLAAVGSVSPLQRAAASEAPAHKAVLCQPSSGSRADDGRDAPSSRINGRVDWDTDYPSQLAPEALDPSCEADSGRGQGSTQPGAEPRETPIVSSSRINGRLDWDTDYPSQLAPEAFGSSCQAGAPADSCLAQARARTDDKPVVSRSRINGRADYPSQPAPEAVNPSP